MIAAVKERPILMSARLRSERGEGRMTLPTACPKPPRPTKKAKRPLPAMSKKRRAIYTSQTTCIEKGKPRTPVKKRNPKRQASEFARCYHSRARVAFVKSLPCLYCSVLHPLIGHVSAGKSQNAHVGKVGAGAGRKANADQIIPLCASHHRKFDTREAPLDHEEIRAILVRKCADVEAAWRPHCEALGIDPTTGKTS